MDTNKIFEIVAANIKTRHAADLRVQLAQDALVFTAQGADPYEVAVKAIVVGQRVQMCTLSYWGDVERVATALRAAGLFQAAAEVEASHRRRWAAKVAAKARAGAPIDFTCRWA